MKFDVPNAGGIAIECLEAVLGFAVNDFANSCLDAYKLIFLGIASVVVFGVVGRLF